MLEFNWFGEYLKCYFLESFVWRFPLSIFLEVDDST